MAQAAQFDCPVCGQPVPLGSTICPNANCKEDLTSLAVFDSIGLALYQLALRKIKQQKPGEALEYLRAAVAHDPTNVDIWVVMGKLQAQAGRYADARLAWEQALTLQAGEPRASAGLDAIQRLEQRRRRNRLASLLAGALLVFVCGLAGGRASLGMFPWGSTPVLLTPTQVAIVQGSPSPQATALTVLATATATFAPSPSPTHTKVPTLTLNPTATSSPTPTMVTCRVTTGLAAGKLNVRRGPGMNNPVLGWVAEGDVLVVAETPPDSAWIRIDLPDGGEGWVYGNYCR